MYLSDAITLATVPTYITLNYPSLTIGPTAAGDLSTTPQTIYAWKNKVTQISSGATIMGSLSITIDNECSTATITPNTAGDTYTY